MNSDTIYYLNQKLADVRGESVNIIKGILDKAELTEFNLQEVGTGDYPVITEGDAELALAAVNVDDKGNLWFEFDGEFDSTTKGEDDMYAEDLLEIAAWFINNEDDITDLGEEEDDEYEE